MSAWIGRLVKTLEAVSRRGEVVDDLGECVVVRFRGEFGMIEGYYSKRDVQFID